MKNKKNIFRIFIAFILFNVLTAQHSVAEIVKREFGFELVDALQSKVVINALWQSSDGFVWMGTDNGLLRYDGHQVRTFLTEEKGLSNNVITDIVEDDRQNLWITTYGGGLNRFSLLDESFKVFKTGKEAGFVSSNTLMHVEFSPSRQALWIGSRSWLNRFDLKSGLVERIGPGDEKPLFNNNVWSTVEDDNGNLWMATLGEGVYKYEPDNGKLTRFGKAQGLTNEYVRSLAKDLQGNLWAATDAGLNKIVMDTGEVVGFRAGTEAGQLHSEALNKVFVDSLGIVWIGSWGEGVSAYDGKTGVFQYYNFESLGLRLEQTPKYIYDFMEDREGTLWVATEKGAVRWPKAARSVSLYGPQKGDSEVSAVVATNTGLWFSVGNHLYRLNSDTELTLAGGISTLAKDEQDNIWVGTAGAGLYKVSGEGEILAHYHEPFAKGTWFWVIKPLADSKILLGLLKGTSAAGLMLFDPQQGVVEHIMENESIRDIERLNQQQFLVATNSAGIFVLNLAEFEVEKKHIPDLVHVQDITVLDNNTALLAGDGQGIARLNLSDFSSQRVLDNLSSGYWMLKHQQKIWLASEKDIHVLDADNLSLRPYINPVTSVFKMSSAAAFVSEEHLVFGTTNGLYVIDNPKQNIRSREPKLAFTDFSILNKTQVPSNDPQAILKSAIQYAPKLTLSHEDYLFSLGFGVLSFEPIHRFSYRYRLDGFDKGWIDALPTQRQATYSNVPSGNYRFSVDAFEPLSGESQAQYSIDIEVLPPWWRSPLAYFLYIIAAVFSLYLVIHLRTRNLQKTAVKLTEAVKTRTHELEQSNREISQLVAQKDFIFAAVSHEFRTPLTLILNPLSDLLERAKTELEQGQLSSIKRNALRLSDLVEQILHLALVRDFKEKQLHHYSLKQVLAELAGAYTPLAKDKRIEIELNAIDDVTLHLEQDTPQKLFGNLLSNALKYSPNESTITLSTMIVEERVHIAISDNGVGIEPEKQQLIFERFNRGEHQGDMLVKGIGLGLTIVQELVELEGGELKLDSTPGQGSTFTVILPFYDTNTQIESFQYSGSADEVISSELSLPQAGKAVDVSEGEDNRPIVLFVEDNQELLHYFGEYFGQKFDCRFACDGVQGLEMALKIVPDLIVSDVMMPRMDGYALCRKVKDDDLLCHIPVILLTAKADSDSRIHGWQLYADDYITKPFDKNELEFRILNLLAIRRLLLQRYAGDNTSTDTDPALSYVADTLSVKDQAFLDKIDACLAQNYQNSEFQLAGLSGHMALSDRQLQRKLKALLDKTFSEYLKQYRLSQSLPLIEQGLAVGVVADTVGFTSPSYYSACFKAEYGMTPKQWPERHLKG